MVPRNRDKGSKGSGSGDLGPSSGSWSLLTSVLERWKDGGGEDGRSRRNLSRRNGEDSMRFFGRPLHHTAALVFLLFVVPVVPAGIAAGPLP